MLYFALGIGALLLLVGVITYYFAPRVGPNPFFGVRVGYTFASREVWDNTNRFGGMLMALTGLGVAVLGLLLQWGGVTGPDGIAILTVGMVGALIVETVWLFAYARKLARGTAVPEIAPVKFRWAYLSPVLVTFTLLAALSVYVYPLLPPERLATHFDLNDQPDGWMTRDGFYATFVGLAALFVAVNALVVLVATREPLIAFVRWGSRWRLEPDRGLIYTGSTFALMNLIFVVAMWDIFWFNTRGAHAFPLSILLWLVLALIVILTALFFVLARRQQKA